MKGYFLFDGTTPLSALRAQLQGTEQVKTLRLGKWNDQPLTWNVIDIQDNRAMLLLTEAQLEEMPYNEILMPVTWETCTLRRWLNRTFYENAFSDREKMRIVETKVPADKNPYHPTPPGNATQDRVFLLSILECEKYLPEQYLRIFKSSANAMCWECWWLRSPGKGPEDAGIVFETGRIFGGARVTIPFAVRPVLWINL